MSNKQNDTFYENLAELEKEELLGMLDNPEEIKTGCEDNCDDCLDYATKQIKNVLIDKYGMNRKDLL